MPPPDNFDSQALLDLVEAGDAAATEQLLTVHRSRLKQMVRLRMDVRVARRIDPSDIVQEALLDAAQKLPDYARKRPLPLYPWLRQLAWERLIRAHRTHLKAQRRNVAREEQGPHLSHGSVMLLAKRLATSATGAFDRLARSERRQQVRDILAGLSEQDQELVLLRYVEQLSTAEIAAVLQTTTAAVKMRQLRLLRKLRLQLGEEFP